MRHRALPALVGLVLAGALLPAAAAPAAAASLVVTTLSGATTPGDGCSLPEAVANANADAAISPDCAPGAAADTITFASGGTVTLAARLSVTGILAIDGGGRITLAAGGSFGHLRNDGSLTLRGLALTGGAGAQGGAVENAGTLVVERTTFSGNGTATHGGAIDSRGTLAVTESTFAGNTATGHGGAVHVGDGSAVITGSTFDSNTAANGGAVHVAATASIANSTFAGNATVAGGALQAAGPGASLVAANLTLTGNSGASGASGLVADAAAALTVQNVLAVGNAGGDTSDPATTFDAAAGNLTGVPAAGILDPAGLAANGGPTPTVRLLAGAAAAIGQGDAGVCAGVLVGGRDQRGLVRPAGACDIGAVERDLVAPSTEPPGVGFRTGVAYSGKSPRVRVALEGADAGGSGIASFQLQRRTGTGAWTDVPLAAGAVSWDTTLVLGTAYRFRARAVDRDGNVATAWAETTAVTPVLVQQSYAGIEYLKTWKTRTLDAYSGGTARSASAAGASARLTFIGRAVAVVLATGPARGKARIYIDGEYRETIDLLAPAPGAYRYQGSARRWSSSGTHSIKVVVAGTADRPRVDVDAFLVLK